MPKRTNEYQKILGRIQRITLPKDYTITESAMVSPSDGSDAREIDFLIEFDIPLHGRMKIAIEAKHHRRPLDVQIVEQYVGKYQTASGLLVNKVIIVGNSFSKGAKTRAEKVGFSLQTLKCLDLEIPAFFDRDETKRQMVPVAINEQPIFIKLYDSEGRELPETLVVTDDAGRTLGTAEEFGKRFWENKPKSLVDKFAVENAGIMIHPIMHLYLKNHFVSYEGRMIRLRGILADPGMRMTIPRMKAKQFEISEEQGGTKQFVMETGESEDSVFSATYEKDQTGKPARGIWFEYNGKEGKGFKIYIWNMKYTM